jgi:hypothetical protein
MTGRKPSWRERFGELEHALHQASAERDEARRERNAACGLTSGPLPGADLLAGGAGWLGVVWCGVVTTCIWPPGPWCQWARINQRGCPLR